MKSLSFDLRRFKRRVKLGRALGYGCTALIVGSWLALAAAFLDLAGLLIVDPKVVAGWLLICGVSGALFGLFKPVSANELAKSIDRRAGLSDRLVSALEEQPSSFGPDLQADAERRLADVTPKRVFPIQFGKRQYGALFSFPLPLLVLFLSAVRPWLSPADRMDREQMKAAAPAIQRVLAPLLKTPEPTPDELSLARELQKLETELKRGRLSKTEAQAKAEEISQKAEQMMHDENRQSLDDLDTAQAALDKMKKDAQQLSSLDKKIADLQKRLADQSLSAKARQDLQSQLKSAQTQSAQLHLSDAVKQFLQRLQNDPEYRKLQEMMEQMRKAAEKSEQTNQPPLTPEQIAKMEKELEELAKQIKSDEDLKKLIKEMEESLKHQGKACKNAGVCPLPSALQMPSGNPTPTQDFNPSGAHINMGKKEFAGKGKTTETEVQADQRETPTPSPYIEQRGMARLSGPSSIPLLKEVPASRQRAEEAVNKHKIPKERQELVKKYFESLEKP